MIYKLASVIIIDIYYFIQSLEMQVISFHINGLFVLRASFTMKVIYKER